MIAALLQTFGLASNRDTRCRRECDFVGPRFIESLEERQFLSAAAPLAASTTKAADAAAALVAKAAKHDATAATQLLPISITGVNVQDGKLIAQGKIGNTPFSVPITLGTTPGANAGDTPILNLHLGPIHLDVLGLVVDTSEICLDITAQSGPGNLLGNLLTNVANLLNGGTSLTDVLGGLTSTQLGTLTTGLTQLLNNVFGQLSNMSAVQGVTSAATGGAAAAAANTTDILNLAIGPVDLNLLGLNVSLDNCADGPVTLDISAESGSGKLLGNLLTGVTRLLDNPSNPIALGRLLNRLADRLNAILT